MALTLTPALCATVLKPFDPTHQARPNRWANAFNRRFDALARRYERLGASWVRRSSRSMCLYLMLLLVLVFAYQRLPSSFLPSEDQGYIVTDIQLPPAASASRTDVTVQAWEHYALAQPATDHVLAIMGFSFSGEGANAAMSYVTLKDWSLRGSGQSSDELARHANEAFENVADGTLYSVVPPPVDGLGTSSGFDLRLQDLAGQGHDALLKARSQLLEAAKASPVIGHLMEDGLADAPQINVSIDREKGRGPGREF